MIFLAIDGDNTGDQIEKLFLDEDLELLRATSKEISDQITLLSEYLVSNGFEIIIGAGDNLLAINATASIVQTVKLCQSIESDLRYSAGIGATLRKTYEALKYAKVSGKNCIVTHDTSFSVYKRE